MKNEHIFGNSKYSLSTTETKILVTSIMPWKDQSGLNTLQNIFESFDPNNIYSLYVREDLPNTKFCNNFFQISEISLLSSIFKKTAVVGRAFKNEEKLLTINDETLNVQKENKYARFFQNIFRPFFVLLRELLWKLGKWKTESLNSYIDQSDINFCLMSSWIFINRINIYIAKRNRKRTILYFVDDNFSYTASSFSPLARVHRFFLRRTIKSLVSLSSDVFVISPKMKIEYDQFFKIETKLLTKGVDTDSLKVKVRDVKEPIKLLYVGNLIYGREEVLIELIEDINIINKNGTKIILNVYTQTEKSDKLINLTKQNINIHIYEAVPYLMVKSIQEQHDVLVFLESFRKKHTRVTRLSFSTKLTDYLASGKCILAIGPRSIAPINYLIQNECAIVADDLTDLKKEINKIIEKPEILSLYASRSIECCRRNHDKVEFANMINNVFLTQKKN